jgi:hypothetical protein
MEQLKAFNAAHNNLPAKIGASALGSLIVSALVFVVASGLEEETFEVEFEVEEILEETE